MTREYLQSALEALGKSGITVNGDLALEKHVENEIGNVEPGGTGIQINNGDKAKTPMTAGDKDIKATIEALLKEKDDKGNLIFRNKKQWWGGKIATCEPSAWGAFKDLSDNYRQQYEVAGFLMQRLGIKS